jgi:cytochrome c peroxidase
VLKFWFPSYRWTAVALSLVVVLCTVLGRAGLAQTQRATQTSISTKLLRCNPDTLSPRLARECRALRLAEGRRLFEDETFGGNGRTCVTCHSIETGTFSQADVLARIGDLSDPLFRHDGLDDGVQGTSRIEQFATVRIALPLPAHLTLADNPSATQIVVNRGTPTTMNTPALDPALMWDLRDPTLEAQASGAIRNHAQNTIQPTALQLELIAEFERTSPRFFSDDRLRRFAIDGVVPGLPEGTTDSEKRGRQFFVDAPLQAGSKVGVCALCHSGPMLNEANAFSTAVFGNPPGARAFSVGVSEANFAGNPIYTFLVHDGLGEPVEVKTPDIGVLMLPADAATPAVRTLVTSPELPPGVRLAAFANMFKTPTLWGVKKTAPYFHDNSAKDFDEMLKQYDFFFLDLRRRGLPAISLTEQDKEDIKAFLNLL